MPWPRGVPRSDETRAKMRAAHAGRPGRSQTPETRAKISAARTAREARKPPKPIKTLRPRSGYKWTSEQRANLSAAKKGVPWSDEARARVAVSRQERRALAEEAIRAAVAAGWPLRVVGGVDANRPRAKRPSGPCEACGVYRISLHREHIVPKCKGGADGADNIQWLCANCHEDKTRNDLRDRPGGMKGRKHSEATRQKMSESARRRLRPVVTEKVAP